MATQQLGFLMFVRHHELSAERNPMDPVVRPATQADVQDLKDLDTMVPIDPDRAEAIDRWLRDTPVLVAEVDGQVVGYGVFDHGFFGQSNAAMLMVLRALGVVAQTDDLAEANQNRGIVVQVSG